MHMIFSCIMIILCDSPSGADIDIKLMSATDLKNKMIMCMIAVLDMGALHIISLRVITGTLIINHKFRDNIPSTETTVLFTS